MNCVLLLTSISYIPSPFGSFIVSNIIDGVVSLMLLYILNVTFSVYPEYSRLTTPSTPMLSILIIYVFPFTEFASLINTSQLNIGLPDGVGVTVDVGVTVGVGVGVLVRVGVGVGVFVGVTVGVTVLVGVTVGVLVGVMFGVGVLVGVTVGVGVLVRVGVGVGYGVSQSCATFVSSHSTHSSFNILSLYVNPEVSQISLIRY